MMAMITMNNANRADLDALVEFAERFRRVIIFTSGDDGSVVVSFEAPALRLSVPQSRYLAARCGML